MSRIGDVDEKTDAQVASRASEQELTAVNAQGLRGGGSSA